MTVSSALPFGTMSRDQLFCLAAWLVNMAETKNSRKELNAAILERLLACFPEDPADPPFGAVHRRLARGCSPEALRQFLQWLFDQSLAAGGLDGARNTPEWAYARCWSEVETIMTEVPRRPWTAKPPNPWLHKVTPELAWAALRRLSGPFDQRGPYEQLKEDALALLAVLGRWDRLDTMRKWDIDCPACAKSMPLLRDPVHITRCQCHPAHRRLAAAQRAAGLEAATTLPVDTRPPFFTYQYEAEKAVDALALRMPDAPLPDLTHLESALIEWERSLPGYAFVCPDCKEAMAIQDAPKHLMECARHPAALLAAELEDKVRAQAGVGAEMLLAVTAERDAFHSMLSRLSDATETFADNLHWSRDGLYSKSFDERAWWTVQEKAHELLGYARRVWPRPPVEVTLRGLRAPEMAYYLRRIVGKEPRPAEPPQLDLFRPPADPNHWLVEEVQQLRRMLDRWRLLSRHYASFGTGPTATFECAACHRPGIPPEGLVPHLLGCRLLPANARARAAVAELWAIGKVARATAYYDLAVEELNPTEFRRGDEFQDLDAFFERWSADASRTLDRLARGEPARPEDEGMLLRFVPQWAALEELGWLHCPGCEEETHITEIGAHMMGCEQLEAAVFARRAEEEFLLPARGSTPLAIAGVRRESDVLALGLARLVDANRAYCNGMHDLDGGRALQDERQVRNWEGARAAARAVLGRQRK